MTVQDTQKVLAYITAAFPRYFANVGKGAAENMIMVWSDTFADYSLDAVMTGVRGYISTDYSGFPPAPGQVVEYIHKIGNPADHSGTEAWSLVRRAVNVPWDQFDASFATLPKIAQIAVGSPESLKELAKMDTHQFETVAQSNFLRMYDAAKRREKTEDKFPAAVIRARPRVTRELTGRPAALASPSERRLERRNETPDNFIGEHEENVTAAILDSESDILAPDITRNETVGTPRDRQKDIDALRRRLLYGKENGGKAGEDHGD